MAFTPYRLERIVQSEALIRAEAFWRRMDGRRSVRSYSPDPVPRALIEYAIRAASTAPSGAHMQPWTFAAVANPALKHRIREAAEREERKTYEERMPDAWREALAPLGTDWHKPFLEVAPWLVVLFAQRWGIGADGEKVKHYYVTESCGIAAGLFITAVHELGLATLPYTPAPMGFLSEILERPENERPMVVFPVGYPADETVVPDQGRKKLDAISAWYT